MRKLDERELQIAKALIRNPRLSDNRLGELYNIPVRTVSRKRARMEQEGLLRYFAEVDMSADGTGYCTCCHLYIIRFKVGVTVSQIQDEIHDEPTVVTVFTQLIRESYVAEIDGRVALVMVVEGTSDADVVQSFQDKIVPSLQKNHGKDSIEDISTIRLLGRVRILRNYLPAVNMENGMMKPDWSTDSIFVA
ncbi:MAG: Lrp/AsnC family transcriptional regulator [Deltaproteobacteria bacterium]|nr:Lrp/AsnC family transcriptional regulator [Deltaproteobacteria bacterium]